LKLNHCIKCKSTHISKKYHNGIVPYYLKGNNRELFNNEIENMYSNARITEKNEHLEGYCNSCGYGWIEEIK